MSFFGIPIRNGLSLGLGTVASLTNGPGFLPDELFYGGTVQGAWYDPSDLTTLFQDSAGTTPVTAVEQAVGLMLDKSKGLVLGSELVTNGDFSGGSTGWTVGTGWSVGSGVASHVAGAAGFLTTAASIGTAAGKWYQIQLDISGNTGGGAINIDAFGAFTGGSPFSYVINGKYSVILLSAANGALRIYVNGAFNGSIDNISVKELPGNHAYQSTSASRPTLRARYNLLTYSEQFENAAWTKLGATVTANAATAPDGTNTADRLVGTSTSSYNARAYQQYTGTVGASYTLSVYARGSSAGQKLTLGITAAFYQTFDLTTDWQRYTLTYTSTSASEFLNVYAAQVTAGGVVTNLSDIFVWGAQLVPTAVFPSNTYQRIGAATDYATGAAFPPYLFFDGTDDSMLTNSVDFATVTSDGQARRNLLLNPTQFDAAGWSLSGLNAFGSGSVANTTATTDPFGGNTADFIQENSALSNHGPRQTLTYPSTGTYTLSIYAKASTRSRIEVNADEASANAYAIFNLANGTVVLAGLGVTASITNEGNGWYRCVISSTVASGSKTMRIRMGDSANDYFYTGDGTSGLFVWGAQLETGSTATAFQNIGTDRMLVVAGVTKQSDAAAAILAELSATAFTNNGAFAMSAPGGALNSFFFRSRGTAVSDTEATFAAPTTKVVTSIADIGADTNVLRVNGTQAATSATDQGTGNFGNYPLYIGRRNNASLPLNGNIYSLIIAGQSYSSGQISSTESWVAAKTPLGTI